VISSVETAEQAARTLQAEPRGKLRVTAPVTYGTHRLMPAIAGYMARYPQVQVELILNNRVVDMVDEGFEVAIRSGELDASSLVARPLRSSFLYAAASPAYLERHGMPQHPEDLLQHNCLGFSAWGKNPQWQFRRGEEEVLVPVRGGLVCNNGQGLLQAALAGVGVVAQADVLLDAPLAAGQLLRILPDWDMPVRPIYIVRTRDLRPTAKVRSFVDFMLEKLS
jgi:DNA-binding transcriptional LysR family regulator